MINFLNLRSFAPELAIYRKILAQALPACLNYLSMSLGGLVLMHFISRYGTHAVAGYGLALRIEQIVMLPTTGIASAVLGIVSQNFGAREYARVRGCYAYAVKFLAVYCTFAAAFCLGLGDPDPMYILPILSALSTWVMSRQTSNGATGAAAQQQKIMTIFMPLFIGYISLSFPSGLVIYWVVSNVFQLIQQHFIYKNLNAK
mgnify:CR=1 FL=1